jgi:hypothetical protein
MNPTLQTKARIAGVFYLLTFIGGGLALVARGKVGLVAGLLAGVCYLAVTLLFYGPSCLAPWVS